MAEADVTELVKRLTRYSEALDRHNVAVHRAYERAVESLANLRRVYAGAAAGDFLAHWDRTSEALERYTEGSRRIKALLDERLAALSAADQPMGAPSAPSLPAGLGGQLRLPFPMEPGKQRQFGEAFGYLQGMRRRDGIPIRGEPGWDSFTRARLDIAGKSYEGQSEGPKEIETERQPGVHPICNDARGSQCNPQSQARRSEWR